MKVCQVTYNSFCNKEMKRCCSKQKGIVIQICSPEPPVLNVNYTILEIFITINQMSTWIYFIKNSIGRGRPWWHSGWESACQCRGHGFEPWSGKIPHAAEQLGPWATTTEPARLEPVLRNKRGRDSERPTHRDEEWPPLATTRESPPTETKTQHSQK